MYDSREDTLAHIEQVRNNLASCTNILSERGALHDRSKLEPLEKEVFDRVTPRLKELEYNSEEYKAQLADMKVALDHHYANNSHHPEHHTNGVYDMNLFDIMEMLCDWKAATERMKNGDLEKSIIQNAERFNFDHAFRDMLLSTACELGWIE